MTTENTGATTEAPKQVTAAEFISLLPSKLKISGGYGDVSLLLTLRIISIDEERKYYERFVDLAGSDEDKLAAEYQILVDGLAAWSTDSPVITKGGVSQSLAGGSVSELVRKVFEARTPAAERLAHGLMSAYRDRLMPEKSFL